MEWLCDNHQKLGPSAKQQQVLERAVKDSQPSAAKLLCLVGTNTLTPNKVSVSHDIDPHDVSVCAASLCDE